MQATLAIDTQWQRGTRGEPDDWPVLLMQFGLSAPAPV